MIIHLLLLILAPAPAEAGCLLRNAESPRSPPVVLQAGDSDVRLEEPGGLQRVLQVRFEPGERITLSPLNGEGIRLYDWTLTGGNSSFRAQGFDSRFEGCRAPSEGFPTPRCELSFERGRMRAEAHFWIVRPGEGGGSLWRLECAAD